MNVKIQKKLLLLTLLMTIEYAQASVVMRRIDQTKNVFMDTISDGNYQLLKDHLELEDPATAQSTRERLDPTGELLGTNQPLPMSDYINEPLQYLNKTRLRTPLEWAFQFWYKYSTDEEAAEDELKIANRKAIITLLIEYGADPDLVNREHFKPDVVALLDDILQQAQENQTRSRFKFMD